MLVTYSLANCLLIKFLVILPRSDWPGEQAASSDDEEAIHCRQITRSYLASGEQLAVQLATRAQV